MSGSHTSKAPIADPRYKLSFIDTIIFKVVRNNIIVFAQKLVGTLYRFGCKDPNVNGRCNGKIDCSGLTEYCYGKAGITLLKGKNAQMQYDYSLQMSNPTVADLVFFIGSYDKNCDGYIDRDDGITHVGIYYRPDLMIAAQGKKVNYYPISTWIPKYPRICTDMSCPEESNNPCDCKCKKWETYSNGTIFDPFGGYGKVIP